MVLLNIIESLLKHVKKMKNNLVIVSINKKIYYLPNMPKKSKKGNTKDSRKSSEDGKVAAAASLSTNSSLIPSGGCLLPISEVMENMKACGKGKHMVKNMLNAGQWLPKSVKSHKTYYRYVIIYGKVQPQTVTHSCSSGSKADQDRAADLKNDQYASFGGVEYVIMSEVVKGDPSLYPP